MTRELVLVHGRSQEKKDSIALKAEWLTALKKGLAKSNLTLPIAEENVRFPFYGDTLYDLVDGKSSDDAAEVIVRGEGRDDAELRFTLDIIGEIKTRMSLTDEQIAEVSQQDVVERGVLNWKPVRAVLRALDRFVVGASSVSIALATHDVYEYLRNSAVREKIDLGVSAALRPGVESVVVAHSLGTVVAYNLLRQQGHLRGWNVPAYITVGSPLAVTAIRKTLRALNPIRCPECVSSWFNAFDPRDIVALYPLDTQHFPLAAAAPAIDNKQDVSNETPNRHGISGYLEDEEVARRIHEALV